MAPEPEGRKPKVFMEGVSEQFCTEPVRGRGGNPGLLSGQPSAELLSFGGVNEGARKRFAEGPLPSNLWTHQAFELSCPSLRSCPPFFWSLPARGPGRGQMAPGPWGSAWAAPAMSPDT